MQKIPRWLKISDIKSLEIIKKDDGIDLIINNIKIMLLNDEKEIAYISNNEVFKSMYRIF